MRISDLEYLSTCSDVKGIFLTSAHMTDVSNEILASGAFFPTVFERYWQLPPSIDWRPGLEGVGHVRDVPLYLGFMDAVLRATPYGAALMPFPA